MAVLKTIQIAAAAVGLALVVSLPLTMLASCSLWGCADEISGIHKPRWFWD